MISSPTNRGRLSARHRFTDFREGMKRGMMTHMLRIFGARFHVPVLLAIVGALLLLVLAGPALAATFTVTKKADTADGDCSPQDCSLREAVIAANNTEGPDIIKVPGGTYTLTIPKGTESDTAGGVASVGDLDIFDDVDIVGAGARQTTVSGGTEFDDRIFDVPAPFSFDTPEPLPSEAVVEIEGLKVTGGDTTGTGGGIRSTTVDFTLRESTVSANQSGGDGGGIRNDGTMSVVRSTISSNTTVGYGGGVFNNGTLETVNSTISGNEASIAGGGIGNFVPGGISSAGISDRTLLFVNATISANEAPVGSNYAEASEEPAEFDGGAMPQGGESSGALFTNTIVANARGGGENCAGSLTASGGNNIDDDGSCLFTQESDIQKDPRLGPLSNNGGPTNTHALRDRSPAIDAADNAAAPPTDQRGVRRPQDGDGRGRAISDIGAFERAAANGGDDDDNACTIKGTQRNDVLRGTERADVICGLGGNDVIVGFGGDDLLQGDAGDDEIDAGPGADRAYGGNGDDAIDVSDGTGRDLADGESGTDSCTVDPGDTVRSCRAT
jgi:CSLREA domain-containing protein